MHCMLSRTVANHRPITSWVQCLKDGIHTYLAQRKSQTGVMHVFISDRWWSRTFVNYNKIIIASAWKQNDNCVDWLKFYCLGAYGLTYVKIITGSQSLIFERRCSFCFAAILYNGMSFYDMFGALLLGFQKYNQNCLCYIKLHYKTITSPAPIMHNENPMTVKPEKGLCIFTRQIWWETEKSTVCVAEISTKQCSLWLSIQNIVLILLF